MIVQKGSGGSGGSEGSEGSEGSRGSMGGSQYSVLRPDELSSYPQEDGCTSSVDWGVTLWCRLRFGEACSCPAAPPCQKFWMADAIFTGVVTDITWSEQRTADGSRNTNSHTMFVVERGFKGVSGRRYGQRSDRTAHATTTSRSVSATSSTLVARRMERFPPGASLSDRRLRWKQAPGGAPTRTSTMPRISHHLA